MALAAGRHILTTVAQPFHGVQQDLIKICPKKTDLVPRIFTLTITRFPYRSPHNDFIGKV